MSIYLLATLSITYLLLLFLAAYASERGILPQRLVQNPIIHSLSLGVYASAWTFYGAFGMAAETGFSYLVSYLGATATFILAPLILIPLLRITRSYQLSSVADLFAFRFRSAFIGSLITLFILVASMPLLAIQIQAFVESVHVIDSSVPRHKIAAAFCVIIALFSILYGARHASLRSRHDGLVVAIALESIVKLTAILSLTLFAFIWIHGGFSGLSEWLSQHPEVLQNMKQPPESGSWRTLFIVFFAAAFITPHMFHLLFGENATEKSLTLSMIIMPVFLLIMALCVPILLWASQRLDTVSHPDFILLGMSDQLNQQWFGAITFIGGLSAASGITIVATVALASMMQNHLLLPIIRLPDSIRMYKWLLWIRRSLILFVMLGSYTAYVYLDHHYELSYLGLITFIGFVQFLPGVLATLYWQRASRIGFLAGLIAGAAFWFFTILLPVLLPDASLITRDLLDKWYLFALLSLLINTLTMILVSFVVPADAEEQDTALSCVLNALPRPSSFSSDHETLEDIAQRLSSRLGKASAQREIESALALLKLPMSNKLKPLDVLRLRNILENNLSGLLGPAEATAVLRPNEISSKGRYKSREIHLLENQLENYHERLSGLAAELDRMRRHHRFTLQRLPIGVCTLDEQAHVLFWNEALENYTGLSAEATLGVNIAALPYPWSEFLGHFTRTNDTYQPATTIDIGGSTHWFSLHKTHLDDQPEKGLILLVEDETEHKALANRLAHTERLASVGRFAAGVAHEIGNPVTGIACLAQNLKLETDEPEVLRTGSQILHQTSRITRIVQSLIRFAHTGSNDGHSEFAPVHLCQCIQEAIDLVRLDERGKDMLITNQVDESLYCDGDEQLLLQVFVNLINNACDASTERAKILIDASIHHDRLKIRVTDDGSGITPEHFPRLFEPFFTTKDPGKGTGLGLSLVYNIITEHYGTIEIISPANKKQNKGTQVIIQLPLRQSAICTSVGYLN